MMNHSLNPNETYADASHFRCLLYRISTLTIQNTKNCCKMSALSTAKMTKSRWRLLEGNSSGFFAEEEECIYAEHTEVELQKQIKETVVNILQIGDTVASNGIKTASAQFLGTIANKLISDGAADDDILKCLEELSKLQTFMSATGKQIVWNPLFIWPVAMFIKQYMDSTIGECCLTLLYADTERFDKNGVPLLPNRFSLNATETFKNNRNCKSINHRESK